MDVRARQELEVYWKFSNNDVRINPDDIHGKKIPHFEWALKYWKRKKAEGLTHCQGWLTRYAHNLKIRKLENTFIYPLMVDDIIQFFEEKGVK